MRATCENIPPDRFNWSHGLTIKLLDIMCELKTQAHDHKINKSLWKSVVDRYDVLSPPNADQCREKFYALKRTYRNFISESNKTGSGKPKPFIYEAAMHSLLDDDPAFRPLICKSSFRQIQTKNYAENDEDDDNTNISLGSSSISTNLKSCQKKRKNEEIIEYMERRDEHFLSMFKEMQEKQNKLMEKVIEKL